MVLRLFCSWLRTFKADVLPLLVGVQPRNRPPHLPTSSNHARGDTRKARGALWSCRGREAWQRFPRAARARRSVIRHVAPKTKYETHHERRYGHDIEQGVLSRYFENGNYNREKRRFDEKSADQDAHPVNSSGNTHRGTSHLVARFSVALEQYRAQL